LIGVAGILALMIFIIIGTIAQLIAPVVSIAGVPVPPFLLFTSIGGVAAALIPMVYEVLWLPPALRDLIKAWRTTGYVLIAIGLDGKLRFIPAKSDGHFITPTVKPYSEKYLFVADGESVYSVNKGKGLRAAIVFMKYPYTLAADKMAAISVFSRRFRSIEDLHERLQAWKELQRLGGREEVERLLEELASRIERAKDEEKEKLQKQYEYLVYLLERAPHSEDELIADLGGVVVRASDLVNYLVWKHHPADLKKIVNAETAALLEKMREGPEWRRWLPMIVVSAMVIMGVLAAIKMLVG